MAVAKMLGVPLTLGKKPPHNPAEPMVIHRVYFNEFPNGRN